MNSETCCCERHFLSTLKLLKCSVSLPFRELKYVDKNPNDDEDSEVTNVDEPEIPIFDDREDR